VSADNGSCAATNVSLGTPATADNCGVASVSSNAPASYPVGTTTVTWTVTDVNGNSASCTQVVTVTDNELPTISCAAAVSVSADNGSCAATNVSLGTPATADNCGVASVISNAPVSYPVGATTVTWTVTDVNGNSASCTQVVTVTDNELPTVVCPSNITIPACVSTASWTVTSGDNCGVASVVSVPASGSSFNNGTTPVTVTVTDVNGNVSTCSFTVTRAANLTAAIAPLAVSPISTCAYGANNANIVIGYGNGPQTVTLNGSSTGGTPAYTYSWYPASNLSNASAANPVFTPNTTSGCSNYTYTLTVTDANGCTATQTVTVKVVNVVSAYNNNGSVKKVRICHITSSATNAEVDIEISPNGVPAHLAHGDCLGDCQDDCDPNARFAHIEHNDHFQGGSVEVFPNPNNGDFAVNITPAVPNADVTVQIFDITGKLIYTKTYVDATYIHEDISLQQLTGSAAPGMYLMKVVNDEYVFTKKITVTQ
ncbi:MAG: HYR domain-containing protein, partial [Bacteroidia bacterium]